MKLLSCLILIALSISFPSALNAQRQTLAGINLNIESSNANLEPGFGATIEHRFTRRSGIESGIYLRNEGYNIALSFESNNRIENVFMEMVHRHISIPILYKFYSRIVNVSLGPSFDYYIDWKQRTQQDWFTLNEYDRNAGLSYGLMFKISKGFSIGESLVLEPELRSTWLLTSETAFLGFGIAGKYRLGKRP